MYNTFSLLKIEGDLKETNHFPILKNKYHHTMRTMVNQLLIIFILLSFSNVISGQANCICNGEDLTWLEDLKNELAEEILNPPITPCGSTESNIFKCNYLGQTVFSYLPTSLPCDVPRNIVDCNGDLLFTAGGFCNGPCRGDDLAALLTDCQLIYSAPAFGACDDSCAGSGDVVLAIGCVDAEVDATNVCVPVTAGNFTSIAQVQSGVFWDPAELSFVSLNEGQLTAIATNENQISTGVLRFLWIIGFNDQPVTLNDNDILFELCFDIIAPNGLSPTVYLGGLPGFNIEIATLIAGNGVLLDHCIQEGKINIGQPNGGDPGDFLQEIVSCEEQAIPTMGEWGLICLGFLLLIVSIRSVQGPEEILSA